MTESPTYEEWESLVRHYREIKARRESAEEFVRDERERETLIEELRAALTEVRTLQGRIYSANRRFADMLG